MLSHWIVSEKDNKKFCWQFFFSIENMSLDLKAFICLNDDKDGKVESFWMPYEYIALQPELNTELLINRSCVEIPNGIRMLAINDVVDSTPCSLPAYVKEASFGKLKKRVICLC